jgi:nicotinamide mononucleotide transporter
LLKCFRVKKSENNQKRILLDEFELKRLISSLKLYGSMKEALDWITANKLEIAAAIVSITYVILSIKQIKWLWWFGLASAVMFAVVYWRSGFYAGMGLQVYYAGISIYGWFHWRRSSRSGGEKKALPVTNLKIRTAIWILICFLLIWLTIYVILLKGTDSTIPVWDSLFSAGGIVATWMLAQKIIQHWFLWMVIDSLSIGVYISQGLYATSVLFGIYIITATIGYLEWRKSLIKDHA